MMHFQLYCLNSTILGDTVQQASALFVLKEHSCLLAFMLVKSYQLEDNVKINVEVDGVWFMR